jgi:hypothetical protein
MPGDRVTQADGRTDGLRPHVAVVTGSPPRARV